MAVLLISWSDEVLGYRLFLEIEPRTGDAARPQPDFGLEQRTLNDFVAGFSDCRRQSSSASSAPTTAPLDLVIRPAMRIQSARYQYLLSAEITERVRRLGLGERLHALFSAEKRAGLLAELHRLARNRYRLSPEGEPADRLFTRLAACGYAESIPEP